MAYYMNTKGPAKYYKQKKKVQAGSNGPVINKPISIKKFINKDENPNTIGGITPTKIHFTGLILLDSIYFRL